MFTGIITSLGTILLIKRFDGQMKLRIKLLAINSNFKRGESIAVNGVCLTVDNFNNDWFEAYVSAETAQLTNLQKIKILDVVNLEKALVMGASISGHFVSGHVDTIAAVSKIIINGYSKIMLLEFDKKYSRYFVPKCSVALDGVSLTVNKCGEGFLEVNVIPETLLVTTISKWNVGYVVNLEIDLINKYLKKEEGINLNFLANCGFDL